jgi:predicted metal-dependent phosphotriesterase family hydrolase
MNASMENTAAPGFLRTVEGDLNVVPDGYVYSHEHLLIDSPLVADRFPAIHLDNVDNAVQEASDCRQAGAAVMVDTMPCASGRNIAGLSTISQRAGVAIIAATGLHHNRYYGDAHWSNRVDVDTLAQLFIDDLVEGIDVFDYTGPAVRRHAGRAGVIKVATSGAALDPRDRRNLEAAALASVATGAPIITHCEGGRGGAEQIDLLTSFGVPASSITLSHVDKSGDLGYITELASSGAFVECDQILKYSERALGAVENVVAVVERGWGEQVVVGTDGAKKALWKAYGGGPGLAWLASTVPGMLRESGLSDQQVASVMRENALRAFAWRTA